MLPYVSTKGGVPPTSFDRVVLEGFAADQGLFVPQTLPHLSAEDLLRLKPLSFPELAGEILSLFIDPKLIPRADLEKLISRSLAGFSATEILPLCSLRETPEIWIMELFHGPTLSFKDLSMGFLIRVMDYLLKQENHHLNLLLATTGDTGPAAVHAVAASEAIDCWPLYPAGGISPEQEGQMTGLQADNVHPVRVTGCPDGVNDLDLVLGDLFGNATLKEKLQLSSVNSINWCRVMFQAIHYFYGYFRVCDDLDETVVFSVPCGAFGNMFGGFLARMMGLPVSGFVCSVNRNHALETVFSTGLLKQEKLFQTVSPAIDIIVPYNFWRYLYYIAGEDPVRIGTWMERFDTTGELQLPADILEKMSQYHTAISISDETTLATIRRIFESEGYLLDPHGAVALAGAESRAAIFGQSVKTICLATAHPAKFSAVMMQAVGDPLPHQAFHPSLHQLSIRLPEAKSCPLPELRRYLVDDIGKRTLHG
jgi:threonine synthase